jgi:phosphoenolpyruvate carboxylase
MKPAPDTSATTVDALRDSVRTLGALLGSVLKTQGDSVLFDRVESARQAARACRRGDPASDRVLDEALGNLSPPDATEVVRAFSAYFGLVNMAERVHRIHALHTSEAPAAGGLRDVIAELAASGTGLASIRHVLSQTQVVPVFTAHPTEAVRRTLLVKEQRFARALAARLDGSLSDAEALSKVREEVTISWQTDEHRSDQPTVADEVEHVVFYLADVIYEIVPAVYEELAEALRSAYGDGADAELPGGLIRFGSWVGGDMDGNPNVGADTIRGTLARHRELILARYRRDVRDLFDRLSQSRSRSNVDATVIERIHHYRELMPEVVHAVPTRYAEMPYRVLLWLVAARLDATTTDAANAYTSPQELERDLRTIADSLLRHNGPHAGGHRVEQLIRRVQTFGFHLATLDVRQDAEVNRRVAGQLLGEPELSKHAATERTQRLVEALAAYETPEELPDDEETRAAVAVMTAIREGRRRYGTEAIGPYIVSMAQGADDVLAVLWIARCAGFTTPAGAVPLDVAPLLETVDDLDRGRETLQIMLANSAYREHLRKRDDTQIVMLGYSDSSKESGVAASRWALYRAQEELVSAAEAAGIRLSFFHGRGGSISRGGSKPRDAILAEPPGSVASRFRITEQGEIIHAKYGLRTQAERTLELLAGAVLQCSTGPGVPTAPEPAWREMADTLAASSRSAYRELVSEHPRFIPYFRAATPIDVIERLTIGSRPVSRRGGGGVENLRAIPWVFAWMQSRHLLPGWYGLGTGLERTVESYGLDTLRQLRAEWPFLATLLGDAEMVLAKADLGIARRYAHLAGDDGQTIFPLIQAELERTRTLVCSIQEIDEPLDREPLLQRSIQLRNPYVDPMSQIQVELLARWRASDRTDPALERALFTSVIGIARGMQNTG